ncbi:MAG: hypothetical protein AAF720_02540 [Pseudomonadota bacterium]
MKALPTGFVPLIALPCEHCNKEVSLDDWSCPHCGLGKPHKSWHLESDVRRANRDYWRDQESQHEKLYNHYYFDFFLGSIRYKKQWQEHVQKANEANRKILLF